MVEVQTPLTLTRIGWAYGNTLGLLSAFSNDFIKMQTLTGRNLKYSGGLK